MMEKQTYRSILRILGEMRQNLSRETARRELRPAGEYVSAFSGIQKECEAGFSPARRVVYRRILDRLMVGMEKMDRKGNDGRKHLSRYARLVEELEGLFRREKEVKKELVFLPYSAAMWDCMESVWRAARRDAEHCRAYVVPIPYYTKKPDGTPDEWRCDAERFPKEVPVLDWQGIDLAGMHPDVIVIHNPYDARNRTSAVDGRYYPEKLRECTEKLVYIPYFVFRETDLEKDNFREHAADLVAQPGVLYSHLTIVQSGAVRKFYLETLDRVVPGNHSWEKRILALGSPKFDKMRELAKEKYPLPKEWQRILAGRKVILYNTSIKLSDVPALEKYRDTIEAFRGNENVALWWRPHPLLEASLRSQCTEEIFGMYRQIVESYREEGWGIYDDTPDLYRAVAHSDALYGDNSSVAVLYGMTGKPVLIQNYRIWNSQEGMA